MGFRISKVATVLVIATAVAGVAQAQSDRLHLGARLSYQFDLEDIGIGVQFSAPIAKQLEFYPSFDYFLVNDGNFWNLNADLKLRVARETADWLYLGGGLNLARSSRGSVDDLNAGINVFVGAEARKGRVHPFGEFRFTANDGSTGQIAVGFNVTLTSH